ncbi:hypothetical protein [Tumebacillus lipolyticus]|uniref:Uncharacterized protein n=1 Tax=Tumebacillus lipolyticus TaxID=1280370 RepID=A0ABW5A2N9_9BACL
MAPIKFILELLRILIVFFVVYALLGFLGFGRLDEDGSNRTIWAIHLVLAVVVTSVWYRLRGRKTGWI